MRTTKKRLSRVRKVLLLAAAIGCSSASLSGALTALAVQQGAAIDTRLA